MSWFFLGLHLGESHCGLLVDAQLMSIPAFHNSSSLFIFPSFHLDLLKSSFFCFSQIVSILFFFLFSQLAITSAILSLLFILFSNLYHLHQTDFACYGDGGVDATST